MRSDSLNFERRVGETDLLKAPSLRWTSRSVKERGYEIDRRRINLREAD